MKAWNVVIAASRLFVVRIMGLLMLSGIAEAQQHRQLSADPNFSLDVRFLVPHPLATILDRNSIPRLPDLIFFDVTGIQINSPVGSHSARLYNGETLLGVVTNSLLGDWAPHYYHELGSFQTASSAYYGGANRQTVIDFASIIDGSIQGRVMFSISRGSFEFLTSSVARAFWGLGGPGGTFGNSTDVVPISSVRLIALDPPPAFDQLASEVTQACVGKGVARTLLFARTYYDAGDIPAACAQLTHFVSQVDGLATGKKAKLSVAQASRLNSHADGLMNGIGCN